MDWESWALVGAVGLVALVFAWSLRPICPRCRRWMHPQAAVCSHCGWER